MKRRFALIAVGLLLVIAAAAACTPAPTVAPPGASASPVVAPTVAGAQVASAGADPFAYCATVENIDAPDARWTGAKVPDQVISGLRKAMGVSADMPADLFARGTSWRCMNKQVYACNVGANIPCSEKADTSKTPSAEMNDFCKANPAADVVPAAVTGRATVYSWKCVGGVPTVDKQVTQPDARGFLAAYWYLIEK